MSDEQAQRKTIVALTGAATEGNARLQATWVDSEIEISVTEEKGAASSVVLSRLQAYDLARLIMAALRPPPSGLRCACGAVATIHVTEFDAQRGEAKLLHLCERHAQEYCNPPSRKPPEAP
jgi:hypothetical protein